MPLEDAKFKSLKIAFFIPFQRPNNGISPVRFKIFHQIQRSMAGATRHCGRQRLDGGVGDPDIRTAGIFLVGFQRLDNRFIRRVWS